MARRTTGMSQTIRYGAIHGNHPYGTRDLWNSRVLRNESNETLDSVFVPLRLPEKNNNVLVPRDP